MDFGANCFRERILRPASPDEPPLVEAIRLYFCPDCGSTLYWKADNLPGMIGVAIGGLADPNFRPCEIDPRAVETGVGADCGRGGALSARKRRKGLGLKRSSSSSTCETMRMSMRRFTRWTSTFSNKFENRRQSLVLYFYF